MDSLERLKLDSLTTAGIYIQKFKDAARRLKQLEEPLSQLNLIWRFIKGVTDKAYDIPTTLLW